MNNKKEEYSVNLCNKFNNKITIVSSVVQNRNDKIQFKCSECDEEFEGTYRSIYQSKNGCPLCARKNTIKAHTSTLEQFLMEMSGKEIDKKYKYLSSFTKKSSKAVFECLDCGNIFKMTPSNMLFGQGCPPCKIAESRKRFSHDDFALLINEKYDNAYTVLDTLEYSNMHSDIMVKHNTCGGIFKINARTFYNNGSPLCCNISSGELLISKFLNDNNIAFEQQKTFDGCKNIKNLRFDFYIEQLNTVIEYDGEFHYETFGNMTNLEYVQNNDNIKNVYCATNNITIIRIPYWEKENIQNILNDKLKI
ncbi:MAG: hypothetical protein ACRC42_02020 [Mycoplasma sp.]